MSSISDFRIKVLKEQNDIHQDLLRIKALMLTKLTYPSNKEIISFTDKVDIIINELMEIYTKKVESV
ncbi:MAG TPA: hypothetical protein VL854_05670 [Nitrososphaeraceae archaeon]|nr:hypothetical protein [Nitrososphaeraceae archaeon]